VPGGLPPPALADPEVVSMRTSWTARVWLVAGLLLGLGLWLGGCDAGGEGEDGSATRPSIERSGTLPAPSVTGPDVTVTTPTRTTRTTTAPPTSDAPATSVEPTTSATSAPTTAPPTSAEAPTTASTAAGTPAAAESGGLGVLGWALLALLVVGLVAGWLLWRSRRRSAWDAQAVALEDDTRAVTGTQLPSVLTAEDAGQRALSWPPVRAALVDLTRRWGLLAEGAPDDVRRDRAGQVRGRLQELVAAVEAENEALATGRDWRLLRPRVDEAGRALSAALAGGPQQQEPPFRGT
jgi:hypothetical protein